MYRDGAGKPPTPFFPFNYTLYDVDAILTFVPSLSCQIGVFFLIFCFKNNDTIEKNVA
jgi:hypothetical protein